MHKLVLALIVVVVLIWLWKKQSAEKLTMTDYALNLISPTSTRLPVLVGCYGDASTRALPKTSSSAVTVDECAKIAASAGSQYFGMQYPEGSPQGKAQCWYGNGLYDKYGSTNKCYLKDVSGRPLGGVWANSVYKMP
jgi:hypothetical protein